MNVANVLTSIGAAVISSSVIVALINGLFSRGGQRAEAALKQAEAARSKHETAVADHDLWRKEAREAYDTVKKECSDCKQELREAKREHDAEIERLTKELAEIREALLRRLDTVEELLPFVHGMPLDKVTEIRQANRATRNAIWRGR